MSLEKMEWSLDMVELISGATVQSELTRLIL